jgi:hypothetical protein
MPHLAKKLLFSIVMTLFLGVNFSSIAQDKPLTYPEINTALNSKLPNKAFKNKTQVINWLIRQIELRKVDKPLTADREDDLRQVGATGALIKSIRQNSPSISDSAPTVITGKTLSLSKFGTGSYDLEGRKTKHLVRGTVTVKTDGNVDIKMRGITGELTFSGKLTFFDQTTLKITLESTGKSGASGEIEVKYHDRSLELLTGINLVLDGKKATLNF